MAAEPGPWRGTGDLRRLESLEIEKRDAFTDCGAEMRIAMKIGRHRILPDTPEGEPLDLLECTKRLSEPRWGIHSGSSNVGLDSRRFTIRGIKKNFLRRKMLFGLANLWMTRKCYGYWHEKQDSRFFLKLIIRKQQLRIQSGYSPGIKVGSLRPRQQKSASNAIDDCLAGGNAAVVLGEERRAQRFPKPISLTTPL